MSMCLPQKAYVKELLCNALQDTILSLCYNIYMILSCIREKIDFQINEILITNFNNTAAIFKINTFAQFGV